MLFFLFLKTQTRQPQTENKAQIELGRLKTTKNPPTKPETHTEHRVQLDLMYSGDS